MDDLPTISTPRLTLAVVGPEYARRIAEFNRANAAFLAPWEPSSGANSGDEGVLSRVRARAVADARAGLAYSFALLPGHGGDVPIAGFVELSNVVRGVFQACYMGYKLDARLQGHGYMTEAAGAAIEFAFTTLRLHRIMANYMPHNQRSAAVLRRLGFTVEGTAKDYLFIGGQWRDHVLTSLVNPMPVIPSPL